MAWCPMCRGSNEPEYTAIRIVSQDNGILPNVQIFTYLCIDMNVAVLGVGNRARKYLSSLPEGVCVSCLVEPEEIRLYQAAARFGVPEEASQLPGLESMPP